MSDFEPGSQPSYSDRYKLSFEAQQEFRKRGWSQEDVEDLEMCFRNIAKALDYPSGESGDEYQKGALDYFGPRLLELFFKYGETAPQEVVAGVERIKQMVLSKINERLIDMEDTISGLLDDAGITDGRESDAQQFRIKLDKIAKYLMANHQLAWKLGKYDESNILLDKHDKLFRLIDSLQKQTGSSHPKPPTVEEITECQSLLKVFITDFKAIFV